MDKKRIEFLNDIIISAVECNHCGYWAKITDYDTSNITVKFQDGEDGVDHKILVDKNLIERSIKKLLNPKEKADVHVSFLKNIWAADYKNDASLIGGEEFDIILQMAVLNDVIYG